MELELRYRDRCLTNFLIIGIILLIIGLVFVFTGIFQIYIPLIIGGLLATVIGILNFKGAPQKENSLRRALHERVDHQYKDANNNDELSTIANEWFKSKADEIENKFYTYIFIETENPPKNAICMISRTTFQEYEEALQCPNCENYFQRRYMLDWLRKSNNCPICQTRLKIKKI